MANRRLFSGLLLLAPLLVNTAYAKDEVDPNGPDPLALEEIVVTANKRAESIQEVPMSVTAFTSEFFKDAGVTNLQGLEQYTPSLKITPGTDSNSTSIRIRGIGSVGTNAGIDPSVGMFIDGVYQGRAGMSIGDLIDIERVEILRGPQGTLYGKNTAAGAISIITMAPSPDALESTVETTYNSDERAEIHAMVNVPFGDSGNAMRLTGYGIDGDYLYKNAYTGEGVNDANKWGVKSRTLFDTGAESDGDGFGEFLLTLDYSKEDTTCCALAVIDYDGLSTLNAPGTNTPSQEYSDMLGLNAKGKPIMKWESFENTAHVASDPNLPLVGPPPRNDPFGNDYWFDHDIYNKVDVGGTALEWNKDVAHDNVLTFINAWRKYTSDSAYDGDFTAYDAVGGSTDIDFDQYSSELRLTSPGGATLDYQGGLYYYYSEMDSVGTFTQSVDLVNALGIGFLFPGRHRLTPTSTTTPPPVMPPSASWCGTSATSSVPRWDCAIPTKAKRRKGSQITTPDSELDIPPVAGPDVYYDESRSDGDFSPTVIARYFCQAGVHDLCQYQPRIQIRRL